MNRLLILLCFISISNISLADFVDIATVKINGKLVRNLTRDSNPYLINLEKFNVNDTLTITVWTDYGGEYNSYLTYQNKVTNEIDSVGRRSKILLTEAMLNTPYLFSVTFIHSINGEPSEVTWKIFETTDHPRIEKVYTQTNAFVENLKSAIPITDDFFMDSIACNIASPKLDKKGLRQAGDTILVARADIFNLLVLTEEEKEYLIDFNAVDYVQLYNIKTRMYGHLDMGKAEINWISLRLANFSGSRLRFNFVFENNRYKVNSILI